MVFVEFIEALGRIAEKLSIVPYNETVREKGVEVFDIIFIKKYFCKNS